MHDESARRPHDSTLDRWLVFLRVLGLSGVLGGLAALVAFMQVSETRNDQAHWHTMVDAMRAIFYSTVFAGILILVPVGAILWRRHRASLHGRRWFRLMMAVLVVAIPALHISARLTSHALTSAVEAADFARAEALWSRLDSLFIAAFIVFAGVTLVAQIKPRLGQPGSPE
jgi:hypothetical protein